MRWLDVAEQISTRDDSGEPVTIEPGRYELTGVREIGLPELGLGGVFVELAGSGVWVEWPEPVDGLS